MKAFQAGEGVCGRETPSGRNFGILAFGDYLHAHKPMPVWKLLTEISHDPLGSFACTFRRSLIFSFGLYCQRWWQALVQSSFNEMKSLFKVDLRTKKHPEE